MEEAVHEGGGHDQALLGSTWTYHNEVVHRVQQCKVDAHGGRQLGGAWTYYRGLRTLFCDPGSFVSSLLHEWDQDTCHDVRDITSKMVIWKAISELHQIVGASHM